MFAARSLLESRSRIFREKILIHLYVDTYALEAKETNPMHERLKAKFYLLLSAIKCTIVPVTMKNCQRIQIDRRIV